MKIKEEISEEAITLTEVKLNRTLSSVLDNLHELVELRSQVTDEGSKRRGWGITPESEHFLESSIELCRAIKGMVTEFGGGTDNDQDALLAQAGLLRGRSS